ncbi:Zinc finger, RING/FYVE/PHD-type [Artemisia annua]|uniref:Zinc finger, RING/FYVE/PHD-type n=1 Tax=Artemisia annua TaxID=35608 RepID=A0A2U1PFF9_ARTAN|nr:Zinc finger, RING/FYVE/PHD-type [Artemisia annua]
MENTTPIAPFDQPASCDLCRRTLTSDNDPIDPDFITICGDCMFLLLEDNSTTTSNPVSQTTRAPRLRRTRYIARHNPPATSSRTTPTGSRRFRRVVSVTESEGFPRLRRTRYIARHNPPATSSRTTPTGSRRFRRVVSVTESEGFDSVYEESDATYEAYDSDVSVEVRSFLGDDSDTDIDGLNSYATDEAYEDLIGRVQLQTAIPFGIVDIRNPFGIVDDDQETAPFVGHSGDYLDARSFEEILEQLAEADNSRRGPPPAALSFVNNLERVVVNNADHNGLACAICKDLLTVGNVVNRLPCLHLYHPSCIKPWLSVQDVEQRVEDTSFEEREVEEVLNSDDRSGRGAGRWYYMAAQVVTLVGIGLALWLGNPGAIQGSGSVSNSCGSNQRRSRSRRL